MGKTTEGAVWLSEDKLNSFDFWQFWRNTSDNDVIKFLKLFTEVSKKEIEKYELHDGTEINKLKIILANKITTNCHGKEKASKAAQEAEKIIGSKRIDSNILTTSEKKIEITEKELEEGFSLKNALIKLNLSSSMSESKRFITQGAIKLNNMQINNKEHQIKKNDFTVDEKKNYYLVINVGKKKFGFIKLIT